MKTLKDMFAGFGSKSENSYSHSSCCGNGHMHQQDNSSQTKTVYQCSMKCEGDKTYDAPGKCPVCGMNLIPINELK